MPSSSFRAGQDRQSRLVHRLTAATVIASLVGEFIHVARGPALVDDAGASVRIVRFFSFFTIQSNILVALISLLLSTDPARDGKLFRVTRLASLIGITITGIVYAIVLAPIHDPEGTAALTNAGLHYLSPLLTIGGWFVFGPRPRIDGRVVFLFLLWPVTWLIYTLIHGRLGYRNWYPYPFLDVGTLGYGQVTLNALGVTVLMFAAASCYRWLDRVLRPAPKLSAGTAEDPA